MAGTFGTYILVDLDKCTGECSGVSLGKRHTFAIFKMCHCCITFMKENVRDLAHLDLL